jgi:3-oxoacyl-[acyl-carrier-protein] synthase-3
LPSKIVTSDQIEEDLAPLYKRLKLPYGRLEMFSGIKERRFWDKGTLPSDVAAQAGRMALEESGISREDIGCLINSSVSRDFLEPATASVVHEKVGLTEQTMIFDISNACLGFLNAMVVVANMISNGIIKAALVVGGESSSSLVNSTISELNANLDLTRKCIKDSFASLTIGSGAAAAVLVHESISKSKHYLLGGKCLTSSKFNHLCSGGLQGDDSGVSDKTNLLMKTDSETLLNAGCDLAKKTWEETKNILSVHNEDVKHFICHQVSRAHQNLLFKTLNIPTSKDYPTFPFLGNMGSVSLPTSLSMASRENKFQKNDLIALLGIGSGINCMMLGVKW